VTKVENGSKEENESKLRRKWSKEANANAQNNARVDAVFDKI